MNNTAAPNSYNSVAKAFHWIMAVIIIVAWLIGFYSATFLSYSTPHSKKAEVITFHKEIATLVLFLVVLRFLWRMTHKTPAFPADMSPLMKFAAHAGHFLLYAFMLAVPVSGWFYSSAAGYPIPVVWLFNLPEIISKTSPATAELFRETHMYLAYIIGILVVGHVAMAIKHQFIDKDGTIDKMIFHFKKLHK